MKKILLIILSLVTGALITAAFDKADKNILKGAEVFGLVTGAAVGGAAGVGVGLVSGKAVGRKIRKKFGNDSRAKKAEVDIGLTFGVPALVAGTTAGTIAGGALGSKAGYALVAKKRGVSSTIVKVAYEADVSLSLHKALLLAAEKKQKGNVKNLLLRFYNELFGQNGLKRFGQLIAQAKKVGFYGDAFEYQVGALLHRKFSDAVRVSVAVETLMKQKKLPPSVRGAWTKATERLINDLFRMRR